VPIGVAGTIIIPQLNDAIGVRQVRRYALTAERFDAKSAHRIGSFTRSFRMPSCMLQASALWITFWLMDRKRLRKRRPRLAVGLEQLADEMFAGLIETHAAQRQSEEAAEGLASFLEKRPASWI
jgi:methylglutaconyl-CoA hydratase